MQVAIVEDDPIIAKAVSAAVSAAGHQCRWIQDGSVAGKEALIASDLVILDIMLPGEDGLTVLKAARAGGVRTPVIVLTARGLVSEKLQAFEAGGRRLPRQAIRDGRTARPDRGRSSPGRRQAGHDARRGTSPI